MSSSDVLLVDVQDGVAHLTLNRPQQGNSSNPDLLIALGADVDADRERPQHRVRDPDGRRASATSAPAPRSMRLKAGVGGLVNAPYAAANRFSPRMMGVTKPVICVVNGLVNGGGLHFVADCDIIISCAQAAYVDWHVTVGGVRACKSVGVVRRCGVGPALLMALARQVLSHHRGARLPGGDDRHSRAHHRRCDEPGEGDRQDDDPATHRSPCR